MWWAGNAARVGRRRTEGFGGEARKKKTTWKKDLGKERRKILKRKLNKQDWAVDRTNPVQKRNKLGEGGGVVKTIMNCRFS